MFAWVMRLSTLTQAGSQQAIIAYGSGGYARHLKLSIPPPKEMKKLAVISIHMHKIFILNQF